MQIKRLRNIAVQLLAAYIVYLRKKESAPVEAKASQKTVEIQPGWIKYDFKNAQSFERTTPVYCSIAGVPIEGKNWARILIGITEQELARHNAAMDGLYKESLIVAKKTAPFCWRSGLMAFIVHSFQMDIGYVLTIASHASWK